MFYQDDYTISLKKAETNVFVDFANMPEVSKAHILEYGLRQILNDAMASAKDKDEAESFAMKRLGNLMTGTLRASPNREADPVKAEAVRIATGKIKNAPAFKRWLTDNDLKPADKDAVAKLRELAGEYAKRDDILDVARANVAAIKDMDLDIDLDF